MDDSVSLLLSIWNGEFLVRIALKVSGDALPRAVLKYPMEPKAKKLIASKLPLHMRNIGEIVEVIHIADVVDASWVIESQA